MSHWKEAQQENLETNGSLMILRYVTIVAAEAFQGKTLGECKGAIMEEEAIW